MSVRVGLVTSFVAALIVCTFAAGVLRPIEPARDGAVGADSGQQEVTIGRPLLRAKVELRVLEAEPDLEPRRPWPAMA